MKPTPAETIDAWQAQLHAAGWSIGDIAVGAGHVATWMIVAHRGHQRVVAKARRQADAWTEGAGWRIWASLGGRGEGLTIVPDHLAGVGADRGGMRRKFLPRRPNTDGVTASGAQTCAGRGPGR
jgi:hypothetical protein